MSAGRAVADMAQEGSLEPGYGQIPANLMLSGGSGCFWEDRTTSGMGSVVASTAHNGGLILNKAPSGVSLGGFARLNVLLGLGGDFDLQVRYDIGTWSPSGSSYLAMRVFDPLVDPGNSITIQRYGTPSVERINSWVDSTDNGIYDIPTGALERTEGIFRATRKGTTTSVGYWVNAESTWHWFGSIVRNTTPRRIHLYTGADSPSATTQGTFSDFKLGGPARVP